MPLAGRSHRRIHESRTFTRDQSHFLHVRAEKTCTRVRVSSRRAYLVDVVRRACAIGINVLASRVLDGLREFKTSTVRTFAEYALRWFFAHLVKSNGTFSDRTKTELRFWIVDRSYVPVDYELYCIVKSPDHAILREYNCDVLWKKELRVIVNIIVNIGNMKCKWVVREKDSSVDSFIPTYLNYRKTKMFISWKISLK